MEKLSKNKIYFIVVAAIALLALILVITTSTITYQNAKKAIAEIGVVDYSETSKAKIDDAQLKLDQFNSTFGASTTFASVHKNLGIEDLQKAKAKYVEAAIRDVNKKYLNGVSDDEIKAQLKDIRTTVDAYFENKDYSSISNYSKLTSLETEFGGAATAGGESSGSQQAAEEPEIC